MDLVESLLSQRKPLTVAQVAELLGLHPITVYRKAKAGKIPCLRIFSKVMFDPQQLAHWVQTRQLG
jgi:excisionase family DNA binding protein